MTVKNVAQAVAEELSNAGVDRVFGLPGGEVLFLIEALRQQGISFDLWRHEANAGLAAAVYGKIKGVPGVVLTTLGPGAANLMLPLSNSLLDREPLLAISAQLPASLPASHTHQRLPLLEAYKPVTKFADELNGFTVRRTLRQALETSLREPAGPSYVTLSAEEALKPSYETLAGTDQTRRMLDVDVEAVAQTLRQRLAQADHPLVVIGIGAPVRVAAALRRWLDAWGLPVAVTPKIKGIVDETADNFVGVVGGMAIDNALMEAINEADLIVGFGLDPVEIDKQWHTQRPILWVLDAPLTMNVVPNDNLLVADYEALLACLGDSASPQSWPPSFEAVRRRRADIYTQAQQTSGKLTENPVAIVAALEKALPPETIVTTDVGSHKYIFGQFWKSRHPATFFMSNGLSGMGYGLSAAVGAKLARPDVPVLAAIGDGGFSMNSQELETLQRLGAPVIVVVLVDQSLSLIQISQENKKLPRYGVDFGTIDTVRMAEACGVEGVRVETQAELTQVVRDAATRNQALVVEAPVDVANYRGLI
ncbi:MAG TPA: thiamine pyrophosphate-binding protein [Phototrophicaceae bacterium]|nr:thiamine pyrophosphate-binding protein [Phototrophicaceae bacterium]